METCNLTHLWHSLLAAALLASVALGDFVGFPIATSTNAGNWYQARDLYNPVGQIYSGIVERCYAVDATNLLPEIIENWTVSAGSSNSVVEVIDSGVTNTYTNIVLYTDTITTTNQFGPFEYEVGTNTLTGYPYLTRNAMQKLDTAIEGLAPYFVSTNVASSGSFDSWFTNRVYTFDTNLLCDSTNLLLSLPVNSMVGIAARDGIGYTTNLTGLHFDAATNEVSFVTGGDFYWTRQPSVKRDWLLSEHHYSTSGWSFVDVGTFDTRYYSDALPNVQYIQGGSNALSSINLTISGTALVQSNQSTVATSEVVSMSSSNVACTEMWYDITNIVASTTPANTGDVYAVAYTNATVLYGDRPYRLYASDLDERFMALRAMVWSHESTAVVDPDSSFAATYAPSTTNITDAGKVYGLGEMGGTGTRGTIVYPQSETSIHDGIGTIVNSAAGASGFVSSDSINENFTDPDDYWSTNISCTINHTRYDGTNATPWGHDWGLWESLHFISGSSQGKLWLNDYTDWITVGETTNKTYRFTNPSSVSMWVDLGWYSQPATWDIDWSLAWIPSYIGASYYAQRGSWPLAVYEMGTNVTVSAVDIYMMGAYPGATNDSDYTTYWSNEPWNWNTNDMLWAWSKGSLFPNDYATLDGLTDLHPNYRLANSPSFTWDTSDVADLSELSLDYMKLIHSYSSGDVETSPSNGAYVVWDDACYTNLPYSGSSTKYCNGWWIRDYKAVTKWDFDYK
jgi:hypothetical protein